MEVFLGVLIVILIISILIYLKSPTVPSSKEIDLQISEDKIPSEINPELIKEFENQTIDDEAINNSAEGNKKLWNEWINAGYIPGNHLTIDFYFYSASEENANKLKSKLEKEGLLAYVYPERTLIILKGWKIKTQIRRIWDLETLNKYEKVMTLVAEKEGPYLEGFAALINN